MVEGYSIRELSRQSRYSRSTIKRILRYWLDHPPKQRCDFSQVRHIICDGTFLHRTTGIYAMMDAETNTIIVGAYNVREGVKELPGFYATMATQGLSPASATVDGNPQQSKYIQATWPAITLQRCLVHVHRQGLGWCRRTPKRTDAKHLRLLFLLLPKIHTQADRDRFVARFNTWERRFGKRIMASSNRGWVFGDLLRARSMLRNALPSLFHYIDNNHIPRTTNALEGYFSRMKEKYRRHRGLSVKNQAAYFQWYFYLVPK
jgi:hypothetical protein